MNNTRMYITSIFFRAKLTAGKHRRPIRRVSPMWFMILLVALLPLQSCQTQNSEPAPVTDSEPALVTEGKEVVARSESRVLWRYETLRPEARVAARDGETAFVVDGRGWQTQMSRVYAINVSDGSLKWKYDVGDYRRAQVINLIDNAVLVAHPSGGGSKLIALNIETGKEIWVFDDYELVGEDFTFVDDIVLFIDGGAISAGGGTLAPSTLYAVDLKTGEALWSQLLVGAVMTTRPTNYVRYEVDGDVVIAENTHTGRTHRLDLHTGEAR
jgi:outer membrane protein assembly factor BamB